MARPVRDMKKNTRPKPAKWLPRDHPKYLEEIEKVDVPLTRVLGATMFIRPRSKGEESALIRLYDRFLKRAEPDLKWWYDGRNGRLRPFEDGHRDYAKRILSGVRTTIVAWSCHSGDRARDAAELAFHALLSPSDKTTTGFDEDLDWVHWTTIDSASPASLLEEALELARATPVRHGTVGRCLGLPAIDRWQLYSAQEYAVCRRYQGLDFPHTFSRAECIDGISTTSWVTFVHNSFLKKLGGAAKLRKQLSDAIIFHEIKEGVAIQAGPSPILGDVNAGEDLSLYREVARALAPIRDRRESCFGDGFLTKHFNTQETMDWLARFET